MSVISNTIEYLRRCQQARAKGLPVSYRNDPAWLVNQAINKRAGWAEDTHFVGSCLPVNGKLPRKARGDDYRHLRQLADKLNTPRLIVRPGELGEWRGLILKRLPNRIYTD